MGREIRSRVSGVYELCEGLFWKKSTAIWKKLENDNAIKIRKNTTKATNIYTYIWSHENKSALVVNIHNKKTSINNKRK